MDESLDDDHLMIGSCEPASVQVEEPVQVVDEAVEEEEMQVEHDEEKENEEEQVKQNDREEKADEQVIAEEEQLEEGQVEPVVEDARTEPDQALAQGSEATANDNHEEEEVSPAKSGWYSCKTSDFL